MEPFFTPSIIFVVAGFGFVAIVCLHLIILLLYKILKHKEFQAQQMQQQQQTATAANQNPSSDCNRTTNDNISSSRETLGSNAINKFGTIKSVVTVHQNAVIETPPKPKLNAKLEKLEYPRADVVYVRSLGQGAFGRVFQVVQFPIHILYVDFLICIHAFRLKLQV